MIHDVSPTHPMDPALKHKLIWDWHRMVLGLGQMVLVAAAALQFSDQGISSTGCGLAAVATLLTIISRIVYRGRTATSPYCRGSERSAARSKSSTLNKKN